MRTRVLVTGFVAAAASVLAAPMLPASAAPQGDGYVEPMIVGGHEATEDYSWMVSMQKNGSHSCGGSLIKPDWVLTAAHCVEGEDPGAITVRIGSKDNTTGGTEAGVTKLTVHPDYDGSGPNDIAVMKLDKPVQNAPVKLAAEAGKPEPSRIIGWGATTPDGSEAPTILQELDTKVVEPAQCTGGIDGATELCTASDTPNANACFGDSGGPEIKGTEGNWELIGITSRLGGANDTECAQSPSIYTNAVAHAEWINQNTAA